MAPRAAISALLAVAGLLVLSQPASAATAKPSCGEAQKFGHVFDVRVGGEPIGCRRAREIIDRPCRIRMKHEWSCFSFRVAYPFIVWFPTGEIFEPEWTSYVIYKRYPCSEARVTRELFLRDPRGFPSLRQLLADDLIRCDLLEGMSRAEVRRLLGPPTYGGRSLQYNLGLERDSFVQIDSEALLISFAKNGQYADAMIFQT